VIGVIALMGIISLMHLHMTTKEQCSRILAMEGRRGTWAELTEEIKPSFTIIKSSEQREAVLTRLALTNGNELMLVRFNGEGLPYYWGWVAYNTNTSRVIKSNVELLW
jgi:hypothetical protein